MEGLGINLGYLIVQILNFAILMVIINAWMIKPVMGLLRRRREAINQGLEDAKVAHEARTRSEEEAAKIIENAQLEATKILREANERAEKLDQEIKMNAAREITAQREAMLAELEMERNRMLQQLRGQVASLAIAATHKLIGDSIDQARQQRLVEQFFSGIKDGKVVILEDTLLEGENVVVTSALPLSDHEQALIKKEVLANLSSSTQDEVSFEFKVDPTILGGLVVRVGDHVIDGSVSGQLAEMRQSLV